MRRKQSGLLLSTALMLAYFLISIPNENLLNSSIHLETEDITRAYETEEWSSFRIYQEDDLVYRAASGDLIPSRPGNELVTCSRNGRVVVSYGSGYSWNSEIAETSLFGGGSRETAEVYSVDAGNLLPEREGDEIVYVNQDYSVNIITNSGEEWSSSRIWRDWEWLYEVDIGELIENGDQPEIVVVGESKAATMLVRTVNGWEPIQLHLDEGMLECCWIGDVYDEKPGNEVVFGGARGVIISAYKGPDGWITEDVYEVADQITDIAVADIDPRYDGNEIITSNILGDIDVVYRNGSGFQSRTIHKENRLVYGLEVGNIDDTEVVAISSYKFRTALLWYDNGYQFDQIYSEEYLMIGTGIMDIDPTHKGPEVLGLSWLGRVTMLYRDEPGFSLELPFESTTAPWNERFSFPVILRPTGGYDGGVTLSIELNGTVIDTIGPIQGPGVHRVNITPEGSADSLDYIIRTTTSEGSSTMIMTVNKDNSNIPVYMDPVVYRGELGADKQLSNTLTLKAGGDTGERITMEGSMLPRGIDLSLNRSFCEPNENTSFFSSTITSEGWVEPGTYFFFLLGTMENGVKRAIGYWIDIKERTLRDFRIVFEHEEISIPLGESITVKATVIGLNGMDSSVQLSYRGLPGMNITLSSESVEPTDEIDVTISTLDANGDYLLELVGIGENLSRKASLILKVIPPTPYLDIEMEDEIILQGTEKEGLSAKINVKISPRNGIVEDVTVKVHGLPNGFNMSLLNSELSRIPYSRNVTFLLSGPFLTQDPEGDPGSFNISIAFLSNNRSWELPLKIGYPQRDINDSGEDDNASLFLIILPVIIILIVVAVILVIRATRPNAIKRAEDSGKEDEEVTLRSKDPKRPELHNGRGSSLGRLGR